MVKVDPYANDPFFGRVSDAEWNACIGRQGHEENYLDGYIEAAIELTNAIIEKRMYAKRDTLVLPILYNARHAVELTLKFATDRLVAAGVVKEDGHKVDHNIKAYWSRLHDGAIGDAELSQTILALKLYVNSLSQIDSNGQELRYHRKRDNDPSLSKYSLANIKLIRDSLHKLEKLLSIVKNRTMDFLDERATGSFTNRCSRKDLFAIARLMPRRDAWTTEVFDRQRDIVKERYRLSNKQFSIALDRIQENREMRAILGMESQLLHLTDDDVFWVVEQWRLLHLTRGQDEGSPGFDYFDAARFPVMEKEAVVRREVTVAIEKRLSPQALADLEAIFYLERDGISAEYYERSVARVLKEHAAAKSPQAEILHLMEKTNLLQCLQGAALRLGRLSLADRLKGI